MTFHLKKAVSATLLFGTLLLLGACRQDPLTLTSDFIDYAYEVPENLRTRIEDSPTGRPITFWALPTADGTAVLTQMVKRPVGGGVGCCRSIRLVNLNATGAVVSQKTLIEQDPSSGGFEVFPISADGSVIRLAAVERIRKLSQKRPASQTSNHRLILGTFTREGPTEQRPPAVDLPLHVTIEDVLQRADGVTVLLGFKDASGGKQGWMAAVDGNNAIQWQKTLGKHHKSRVHAHEFTSDNTLVMRVGSGRWTEEGRENVLALRTVDLSNGTLSEKSLFGFPRSDMSDTPLGKIAPNTYHVTRLDGGDRIMTLSGWYRNAFDRSRVARVSAEGKIEWITTILKGSGDGASSMVVGKTGEIVMSTDDPKAGVRFISRLNQDGEIIAQHRVDDMQLRHLAAHPDGGYLVWAIHEPDEDTKKWRLLRIKAFPSD